METGRVHAIRCYFEERIVADLSLSIRRIAEISAANPDLSLDECSERMGREFEEEQERRREEFRKACAEAVSEIQAEVEPLKRIAELPRHDPRRNWILHRLPLDRARREAVRLLARPRSRERRPVVTCSRPRSRRERTVRSGRSPPGSDDPHLAPASCPARPGSLTCAEEAAS